MKFPVEKVSRALISQVNSFATGQDEQYMREILETGVWILRLRSKITEKVLIEDSERQRRRGRIKKLG